MRECVRVCVCVCVCVCVHATIYIARKRLLHQHLYKADRIIVSIYKHTVMNRMSPRQIYVHILMSLANKYSCKLEWVDVLRCRLDISGRDNPDFPGGIKEQSGDETLPSPSWCPRTGN